MIARGSVLPQRPPRWVMAAELVETNRLWARRVAAIEPAWAERIGAHLVRRSYGEPRWDERRGAAVTTETVTLYGLPVVSGRTVPVRPCRCDRGAGDVHPPRPRRGASGSTHHALRRPQRDVPRARRRRWRPGCAAAGLLDDDELFDFYDARVGPDVTSGRRFDQWWKAAGVSRPALLDLTEERARRRPGSASGRLPGHVAPRRHRAAAVLPLRPGRAARRRQRARPADRAQPDRRRRLRLADPRAPAPSSSTRSCARCPRTPAGC